MCVPNMTQTQAEFPEMSTHVLYDLADFSKRFQVSIIQQVSMFNHRRTNSLDSFVTRIG